MTERRGRSRWPAKRISGSSEKIMDELLKYAVENGIIDLTPHGNWKCLILAGLRDLKRTR